MSKRFVGYAVAGALMVSSTVSVAAATPSAPTGNPWASLSMMSGAATAAAYCGSSATIAGAAMAVAPGGCVLPQVDPAAPAVAQSAPPRPIPVPPVEAPAGLYFDPLLIGLGALAIAALVYFLVIKKGGDIPNSPA